jgi:hypothetical protein
MRHLKPLLIFCLCLTMLVTSGVAAFVRGQMAFGQTMQICAEGEPASIILDGRGDPVSAAHPCPDCLAVTAGLPPAPFEFARPLAHWARVPMPSGAGVASENTAHALARGPPALI